MTPVHQSLAPYLVTIDSKDPPESFYKEWTPWMAQSPLLATQTLLNASSYLSDARGLEVANNPERISLQSRIISVINDYLRKKKMKEVDIEAVAAVLYLALNEVRSLIHLESNHSHLTVVLGRRWKFLGSHERTEGNDQVKRRIRQHGPRLPTPETTHSVSPAPQSPFHSSNTPQNRLPNRLLLRARTLPTLRPKPRRQPDRANILPHPPRVAPPPLRNPLPRHIRHILPNHRHRRNARRHEIPHLQHPHLPNFTRRTYR
jgi:hypothetical protein